MHLIKNMLYKANRQNFCLQIFGAAILMLLLMTLNVTPVSAQGAVDIVFAVDESGSMNNEHTTLQQNIQTVIDGFQNAGLDWRFGLVTFGDSTNNGDPVITSALVNNTNALANLQVDLSGSTEPGFAATSLAVSNAMGFRPNAGTCVVLISDEDADLPPGTQLQAINDLQTQPATFFGIVNANSGNTQADYGPSPGSLAASTNGQVFSIANFVNNPNIVLNALTTACVVSLPAQICGTKFNDLNGNGTKDAGEPGLAGWSIFASDTPANGPSPVSYPPVQTGKGGRYCISVSAGTYTVSEIQQPPWLQTFPAQPGTHTVTVQPGQTVDNIDFGNRLPNGSIRGVKFWDVNGNGIRDYITQISGVNVLEPLLDGFQFMLFNSSTGGFVAGPVTINNANAGYVFSDIPPGDYFVQELPYPGWIQTHPAQNGVHQVTLAAGQNLQNINFGNKPCLAPCDSYIMGFKFVDRNHNGQWDSNEANARLGGVTIELLDASGNVIQTTTTNANGLYYFLNVPPGTYTVREQVPAGWLQTAPTTPGGVHTITISHGTNGIGLNFGNYSCRAGIIAYPDTRTEDSRGKRFVAESVADQQLERAYPLDTSFLTEAPIYRPKGCIVGTKFHDINGNGVQDGQEGPLAGFIFILQSVSNPSVTYEVTSDAAGNIHFVVPPGDYLLYEIDTLPGWILSPNSPSVYSVTVGNGGIVDGFDFGNLECERGRNVGGVCQCRSNKLDIKIASSSQRSAITGEKFNYVFNVTNVSKCTTSGEIVVNLTLPSGVHLVEKEWASDGWRCLEQNSGIQCTSQNPLKPRRSTSITAPVSVGADIDSEIQSCAIVVARDDNNYKNNAICTQSQVIRDTPHNLERERR